MKYFFLFATFLITFSSNSNLGNGEDYKIKVWNYFEDGRPVSISCTSLQKTSIGEKMVAEILGYETSTHWTILESNKVISEKCVLVWYQTSAIDPLRHQALKSYTVSSFTVYESSWPHNDASRRNALQEVEYNWNLSKAGYSLLNFETGMYELQDKWVLPRRRSIP